MTSRRRRRTVHRSPHWHPAIVRAPVLRFFSEPLSVPLKDIFDICLTSTLLKRSSQRETNGDRSLMDVLLFTEPLSVCFQNHGFEQKETKNLGRPASIAGIVPYFHFHIPNFCFLLYP